jgi:hypothetical protein
VGEGQSRIDSECQWKVRARVKETRSSKADADEDVPVLISISRPESVRSFDVVPKLKMQSSMRALSDAAVSNRPIIIGAVQGALELRVHVCAFDFEMSMFDRIAAGLEINLAFAVDFSISNGEQNNPSSLHYMGEDINVYVDSSPPCPSIYHCKHTHHCTIVLCQQQSSNSPPTNRRDTMSRYQRMIATFTERLHYYSNAQRIAMLGFGAQLQDGVVSNCFSLNGRSHHPRCDGAAAAMQAYETALSNVNFSGPTCIAPVINAVVAMNCEIWGSESRAHDYHIMIIVVDTPCRDVQVSLCRCCPMCWCSL